MIEKNLREKIKAMGGIALKFHSPYNVGFPDRIVLMPGGRIFFAELKSPGKKPTAIQKCAIKLLAGLGFEVFVIDSKEKLSSFLERVRGLER